MHALLLVDLQNDFMPGGPLGVPHGDEVIPVANRLQPHFMIVVAIQDWHPPNHGSFAASHPGRSPGERIELRGLPQVLLPVHCVQETRGAELAPELKVARIRAVFHKGIDPEIDSYSAFFDNHHLRSTGLEAYLRRHGVTEIYLMGLATEHGVRHSALDGVKLGFKVRLVEDGCRGMDLQPGDVDRALAEMQSVGVKIIRSHELVQSLAGVSFMPFRRTGPHRSLGLPQAPRVHFRRTRLATSGRRAFFDRHVPPSVED